MAEQTGGINSSKRPPPKLGVETSLSASNSSAEVAGRAADCAAPADGGDSGKCRQRLRAPGPHSNVATLFSSFSCLSAVFVC